MDLLLAELLILGTLVMGAVAYTRSVPTWVIVGIGLVPALMGVRLLRTSDASPAVYVATLVVNVVAAYLALGSAQVLRANLQMATALSGGHAQVEEPLFELVVLLEATRALGFEPVPEGIVWLGDMQLAVLAHHDGTRAELVQTPGRSPGYAFTTRLDDGSDVTSVPWSHGIDDGRVRVPGATLTELHGHHLRGVAERVAGGRQVTALAPHEALARTVQSDVDELRQTLARPWRNALLLVIQQSPFRALAGR